MRVMNWFKTADYNGARKTCASDARKRLGHKMVTVLNSKDNKKIGYFIGTERQIAALRANRRYLVK